MLLDYADEARFTLQGLESELDKVQKVMHVIWQE